MLIRPQDRDTLIRLLKSHLPDTEIWAFGSRVTGKAHPGSDLDLVAMSDNEQAIFLAQEALENSALPFRVDLLSWPTLPPTMQENICQHHEVLIPAPERNPHD
ncbi:Nucleotidyltransferase domain-containing protein [Sulfurivirga caldicuralii]|uniref:Nucleotidyltransferase domain-containing protein n=1 Tax=Sulfurivirga caldicuralii TaxID=364032 RepID=A0A1N6HI69_9GAMM|nr:nucleotidyltransferase domain-containing protein [Sulfurivirga caldicuralii]SIO19452.1 Nucleotidyltransferase domain-containing protein [Sulfurivirga caldicuralii]